ncbi:MAG TPA: hypothetical protein VE133_05400 [Candidatus Sulfotelmatobacter sp.]|nr:hypothetical protein [Candidatus Sulfotelmatobacter sp.]
MKEIRTAQFEKGKLLRLLAWSCIVLVILISGLEAMHAHSDVAVSRNSSPCAICLSAHANAPTVTVHVLPQLHTVEAVAVPDQSEGKSTVSELRLFIRPPPVS